MASSRSSVRRDAHVHHDVRGLWAIGNRNALDLAKVIQKLTFKEKSRSPALREFAKVTMQRRRHTTRKHPTACQLPRLKEWPGAEHRRLCPVHGILKCWDQPTRLPPLETLQMMENLTTTKEVGANVRKAGPTLFTMTVDASTGGF